MAFKRTRENGELDNSSNTAKLLMLLSQGLDIKLSTCSQTRNLFQCKTCNRKFPSFQALGGHRASHKKPRLADEDSTKCSLSLEAKPKLHECSICRLQFASGQALGGHMRKHAGGVAVSSAHSFSSFPVVPKLPVLKRSNSCSRRVFGLDLNLTPLENELDFLFGMMAPKVFI